MAKTRIVHYINQFYAGIGGEEFAGQEPKKMDTLPPISAQLQKNLGEDAEVVATIVCGDSYFNENLEVASEKILELIKVENPDILIAGPAFNAGRYGMACGTVSTMVKEKLGIDAFSAMYDENPGVDVFKKNLHIIRTSDSAAGMRKALPAMANFAKKLISKEPI